METSQGSYWHHSVTRVVHWLGPLLLGSCGDFGSWMDHFESLSHTDCTYQHCQSRSLEHSTTHDRSENCTWIGQEKSICAARKENAMYMDFEHLKRALEINNCFIIQMRRFKFRDTLMLLVRQLISGNTKIKTLVSWLLVHFFSTSFVYILLTTGQKLSLALWSSTLQLPITI